MLHYVPQSRHVSFFYVWQSSWYFSAAKLQRKLCESLKEADVGLILAGFWRGGARPFIKNKKCSISVESNGTYAYFTLIIDLVILVKLPWWCENCEGISAGEKGGAVEVKNPVGVASNSAAESCQLCLQSKSTQLSLVVTVEMLLSWIHPAASLLKGYLFFLTCGRRPLSATKRHTWANAPIINLRGASVAF